MFIHIQLKVKDVSSNTLSEHPPKLLNQLRRAIRDKHYSVSTERTYVYWARWYIRFHELRHPKDRGPQEIRAFLSYLNNDRHIAGSTCTQALCALLFLYKEVLGIELLWIDGVSRPKRPAKRPTVLTQTEVNLVLAQMQGVDQLFARLLYGTGMRLSKGAQLRIKDIDFQRLEITIRDGKGGKDRLTMLPLLLVVPLREQVDSSRSLYEEDRLRHSDRPRVIGPQRCQYHEPCVRLSECQTLTSAAYKASPLSPWAPPCSARLTSAIMRSLAGAGTPSCCARRTTAPFR
jgi:integrase